MRFKVGDTVCWSSESAGVRRKKIGVIVEVVPAGARPTTMGRRKGSGIPVVGRPRELPSYVVEAKAVGAGGRVGKDGRKRRYWPRAWTLVSVGGVTDGQCNSIIGAERCDKPSTHTLRAPDGTAVPGGYCLDCALGCITEYSAKLRERWTATANNENP